MDRDGGNWRLHHGKSKRKFVQERYEKPLGTITAKR